MFLASFFMKSCALRILECDFQDFLQLCAYDCAL